MGAKALISVIMPVFRAKESYLREAVESILKQTLKSFELLIIWEKTERDIDIEGIVASYEDTRIKVIETPPKYGLPASLNLGLKYAKGTYIARMDADDISLPGRFEEQYRFMEKNREIDILGGAIKIIGKDEYAPQNFVDNMDLYRILFLLEGNRGPAHPTVFIRAAFLKKIGVCYDLNFPQCEDYKFWIDCINAGGRFFILPKVVLYYRKYSGQGTALYQKEAQEHERTIRSFQLNKIGFFNANEVDTLIHWEELYSTITYNKTIELIKKILAGNKKNRIYNQELLKKELYSRLIVKGILGIKYNHNFKYIIHPRFLIALLPKYFNYVILQIKRRRNCFIPPEV